MESDSERLRKMFRLSSILPVSSAPDSSPKIPPIHVDTKALDMIQGLLDTVNYILRGSAGGDSHNFTWKIHRTVESISAVLLRNRVIFKLYITMDDLYDTRFL